MRQRNINFRQSNAERAGESSYKNFHRTIIRHFVNKVNNWKLKIK